MNESILNCSITSGLAITEPNTRGAADPQVASQTSVYHWWMNDYYPNVIHTSYPVYLQERSVDKGVKAYEIVKNLSDKKLVQLKTVKQFVDLMDVLIKML
jgi:hypothetical protein